MLWYLLRALFANMSLTPYIWTCFYPNFNKLHNTLYIVCWSCHRLLDEICLCINRLKCICIYLLCKAKAWFLQLAIWFCSILWLKLTQWHILFQPLQQGCLYQTLIDIEIMTSSSTFQASLIIVFRNMGYIIGAMVLSRLYDVFHHNLLHGTFCLVAAAGTLAMAYVQSIHWVYALSAVAGVVIGAKDTGW